MTIRDFAAADKATVLSMVDIFYASPGVLHRIPIQNFADIYDEMCHGGSSRLRGFVIEEDGVIAGYCALSFTYSVEAGGTVVLIEEVYIDAAFRGRGFGGEVFGYLTESYRGKAARLRLEVAPVNERAIKLYQRLGFKKLPYVQMVLEDF